MDNNAKKIVSQGYLEGLDLYSSIVAGIKNLLIYQDKLDEINVFPVPDGDTGTNMCFTLLPIIEECEPNITTHVGEAFNLMADTALESARGNSGTIIAQFFHGMRKVSLNNERVYIPDFGIALEAGYNSAIDSLMSPQEGTIITVMRDTANKAKELSRKENINYKEF